MFIVQIVKWRFACAKAHVTTKHADSFLSIVQVLFTLGSVSEGSIYCGLVQNMVFFMDSFQMAALLRAR